MRSARVAGQALSLATESTCRPYVCRACLAQATRQLSTSIPRNAAQEPFYKRLQRSIFGGGEKEKEREEAREASRQKKLEEIKATGTPKEQEKVIAYKTGVEYVVADQVDPVTHTDYVVSTDASGLQRVGSKVWVKQRADGGEKYIGFMPRKQAKLDNEEWGALLHTVAVEVMALREAGRDVLQVCNPRIVDPENIKSQTRGVAINSSELKYEGAEQRNAILASIPETAQGERGADALELELETALESDSLLPGNFELNDPAVKFAIIKRAMQLTGKRVPDIRISNSQNLLDFHEAFATKEKPKKLAQAEELQQLNEAPNIQVHATKRTKEHHDRTIGRWKLIEEELELRGLPIKGRVE